MLNKHLISLLIWCLLTCFYLMGVLEMGQLYCEMKVCQSCLTLFNPMDYTVHGFLQARILEWVAFPFPRASNPGMEPSSSTLQADSLPAEPQGKPQNTGVGSLSLFQQIFPIQELNWSLLHCRWILYQLSYYGSHETKMYPQKISRSRNTIKTEVFQIKETWKLNTMYDPG